MIDPCGVPFSEVYLDEKEFSTLTWIVLLERNPSIQLYIILQSNCTFCLEFIFFFQFY